MKRFYGQERCKLEANSRLKLPSQYLEVFQEHGGERVVLHCWPERCLGILPEGTWEVYCQQLSGQGGTGLMTPEQRSRSRLIFSYTNPDTITAQGRITIPEMFREFLGFEPGSKVVVVSTGDSLEVWSESRWAEEVNRVMNSQDGPGF